jgi:CheY-like chemotaxis protein
MKMAKRILVVEDSEGVRELISFTLRNRGYEVEEASNGGTGWSLLEKGHFDLVLLDAMMPVKSGFEICSDLKSDPRRRDLKVMILTAITRDTGKSDLYWKEKSRADAFLSKPFKPQELVNQVEDLFAPESEEDR